MRLEDADLVARIKMLFAPDGGAEREHNADAGSLGFGGLHYALVTNLRPQRILVVGSRYGFVPSVLGLALKANGAGVLDFVDANYDDATDGFVPAYGGVGHWSAEGGGAHPFAPLGLDDVITVHVMRSEEFFARSDAPYGYIYLDGDHSYAGCRYDLDHAMQRCEPHGLIVLHDVVVTQPHFGVHEVFAEVDGATYDKLVIPHWPGLGILQRRKRA